MGGRPPCRLCATTIVSTMILGIAIILTSMPYPVSSIDSPQSCISQAMENTIRPDLVPGSGYILLQKEKMTSKAQASRYDGEASEKSNLLQTMQMKVDEGATEKMESEDVKQLTEELARRNQQFQESSQKLHEVVQGLSNDAKAKSQAEVAHGLNKSPDSNDDLDRDLDHMDAATKKALSKIKQNKGQLKKQRVSQWGDLDELKKNNGESDAKDGNSEASDESEGSLTKQLNQIEASGMEALSNLARRKEEFAKGVRGQSAEAEAAEEQVDEKRGGNDHDIMEKMKASDDSWKHTEKKVEDLEKQAKKDKEAEEQKRKLEALRSAAPRFINPLFFGVGGLLLHVVILR